MKEMDYLYIKLNKNIKYNEYLFICFYIYFLNIFNNVLITK